MEEGEAKQQLLPDDLFAGAVKEGGVRDRVTQVGAQQVGSQSFWRLVGHLQPVLQDTDWELVRWIAGQPQPEEEEEDRFWPSPRLFWRHCVLVGLTVQRLLPKAGVCVFWGDGFLADHLQRGHPARGQVAVLQHHPGALFDGSVNHLSSYGSLSLTEGDGLRLAASHVQIVGKLQQT